MRCCKPVGQKEQFFMTNCCHLICSPCVKYCIVNSPADSNGHYTIICLVERKPRKIIPLQRLPPEGRSLFKDVTIVSESFYSCYVMLVPSCSLSVSVSQKEYINSFPPITDHPEYTPSVSIQLAEKNIGTDRGNLIVHHNRQVHSHLCL